MITRGATGPTSAPNSPTSRAGTPPSDSEAPAAPAAAVDVVDVTGGSDPWTTTPARRTAEPTPLRPSKRTSAKAVAAATLAEARKGKKRLVRRPASGPVAGKDSAGAGPDSDSSLEDKPAPPPSKKTRKTPATKAAAAVKTPGSAKVVSTDTAQAPRKPARADAGFNLGAFMASFDPEAAISERSPSEATRAAAPRAQEEPAASISAEMGAQLRTLRAEVERLRAMVANQPVSQAATPSSVLPLAVLSAPTAPNAKGELPPSEVCFLTTASFPEGAKKAKGDYNPPQAHMLAASRMFRAFGSETGTALSAMSFVLWMRELESIKFQVTPAVLMAIFSGRLGSRGLTLMHFKESSEMSSLEDGSTNVNFSSDFSPSASLPPASIRCKTYEDILDALHGLNALGQEVWYDHMRKITSRLRNFVAKNKSADPANTPARVRLTLLYANKFIGAVRVGAKRRGSETSRERIIFREDVCFPLRPTSPTAATASIPGAIDGTTEASAAEVAASTLRSGSAIQPPIAKQLSLTIQSGSTIQSPTAIQPVPAIQPAQTSRSPGGVPFPPLQSGRDRAVSHGDGLGATALPSAAVLPPVVHASCRPDERRATGHNMAMSSISPASSFLRPVVSPATAAKLHGNARDRGELLRKTRRATLTQAMVMMGITPPPEDYPASRQGPAGPEFLLNKPLQQALSELARRTGTSLPAFVELVRGQTMIDYRPNKNVVPAVLDKVCKGYKHLDTLQKIVREGVEVRLKDSPPLQRQRPPNHESAKDRLNVLRKNIRKEQDAGRCLVLDKSLLKQWPEIIISPFGVVDKGTEDTATSGRTIHDLSFPEGASINDCTDQDSITKPEYAHCDAVAREILRLKHAHPDARICVMAGDVASAFRNIGIHSNSVYLFAGQIEEDDVIVIELAAPFGWTGSPGFYEITGGAIAHVHGSQTNKFSPTGFFSYHWVDDHINVAVDIGTNCDDMDRSLRFAIESVLGADAINTKKFTNWDTRQRVLGLEFDSVAEKVSMPADKVEKARQIVAAAYFAPALSRQVYRSLMGSLRHVATCIRAARPFLQRLRQRESRLHRFQSVTVSDDMRQDLLWWWLVLHTPQLNGVSLEYFNSLPPPDVVVEMDASDYGLCALDIGSKAALTHQFSGPERNLIAAFKAGTPNGFDINFRELLSCAFAVHAWGTRWSADGSRTGRPWHVHFRIDNTSAVAWQNKLASRNPRAQVIIRLLSWWETTFQLRFSASHIAGADNERADAGSRIAANPSFSTKFAALTPGWLQVSPMIDSQGLSEIWRRISELTPLPTPHLSSTAGR